MDDRDGRSGVTACGHHRAVLQEHDAPGEPQVAAVIHELQEEGLRPASLIGQRHDDRAPRAGAGGLPRGHGVREYRPVRPLAYDVYLRLVNVLLRLPGHSLRRLVFRSLVRADSANDVSLERGVRVLTKGGITVGESTNINAGVLLDGRGGLRIGSRVNISPDVLILTAEHDPRSPD